MSATKARRLCTYLRKMPVQSERGVSPPSVKFEQLRAEMVSRVEASTQVDPYDCIDGQAVIYRFPTEIVKDHNCPVIYARNVRY